jgi:hypothetical protein
VTGQKGYKQVVASSIEWPALPQTVEVRLWM